MKRQKATLCNNSTTNHGKCSSITRREIFLILIVGLVFFLVGFQQRKTSETLSVTKSNSLRQRWTKFQKNQLELEDRLTKKHEELEKRLTKKTAEMMKTLNDPKDDSLLNILPSNLPCVDEPKKLDVMMSTEEQQLLESYMTPTTRYFEWGSGGSTDTYPRLTQGTVVSIENYKPWCDKVSSLPYVKCREKEGSLHYKCIVPYPTAPYGYPEDAAHNGDFDEYINAIKDYPNFDIVLVDARWRVACALKALEYISDDTIVFIHDMNPRRKYYDAVFKWYEEIKRADSLVAMRRRKGVPLPEQETFDMYKNKPNY